MVYFVCINVLAPPPPPTPTTPPVEEDMHTDLPPERLKQFQYILMDLNAKYCSQNFKPSWRPYPKSFYM